MCCDFDSDVVLDQTKYNNNMVWSENAKKQLVIELKDYTK